MTNVEINQKKSFEINPNDATPAMKRFLEIKQEYSDCLILYRMGDFYETFFEDAQTLSKVLEIALTARDCGSLGRIPLAGIPAKAIEGHLEKLVAKGIKIAICEQLEDPKLAKGVVERGVVRVITPGTIIEYNMLNKTSCNYICAIFNDPKVKKDNWGFAYTDVSTGEFKAVQLDYDMLITELARIQPVEIIAPAKKLKLQPFQIVPEEVVDLPDEISEYYNCSKISMRVFEENYAKDSLKQVLKINDLDSIGYDDCQLGFRASAGLLTYIWENMKEGFPKFENIVTYDVSQYVAIDVGSRRNLEITQTLRDKSRKGSLLWAINRTVTNMGARLLNTWLCQPLKNLEAIKQRQEIVKILLEKAEARYKLQDLLSNVYDIQRVSTKLGNTSAMPKDFLSLKTSLFFVPEIVEIAKSIDLSFFDVILDKVDNLKEYADVIERTIVEEPSTTLKEGCLIKKGVNSELDYLRELMDNGESWIKNFEQREKERTGINILKVRYNRVFGYYIEVTNSNLSKVPEEYIRKQTLANAERYITEELKQHENEVLNAQNKVNELEYKLYCDFREYSKEFLSLIRTTADCIAQLDVFLSFATIAAEQNYVCPEIDESEDFYVVNARHPVLEQILPLGTYVPNDIDISSKDASKTMCMILTGPNMAGKSTYMRQNALIAILAQTGCYIPADYAKIGIVDKIFTRVGASDDLTSGKSTFMVEMSETAYILNRATEKSLILIDEIGRGTSTYDGVAIAWSVAEYIANKIKAKCIFATHYHELNVMAQKFPQITNYRITISEQNGEIEFLRKIVQGGASKSYGIQVAKMAGLPAPVINRSQELMSKMQKDFSKNLAGRKKSASEVEIETPQLNLF